MEIKRIIKELSTDSLHHIKIETIKELEIRRENSFKTPLDEWEMKRKCSKRLYNALYGNYIISWLDKNDFLYIEDITKEKFLKIRFAGLNTWNEFVELRGF